MPARDHRLNPHAEAPALSARVLLGKVVGAHGPRGALRVRWLGDGPENLMRAKRVALGSDETAERWCSVRDTEMGRDGEVRIEIEGVETREAAAAHTGLFVVGDTAALATLPPGEHYWYEWIGCTVTTGDGRRLGAIREIWDAGAHDVLVIEEEETRRERLVPVVGALLREVDVAARRIVMDVPEGLLDDAPSE